MEVLMINKQNPNTKYSTSTVVCAAPGGQKLLLQVQSQCLCLGRGGMLNAVIELKSCVKQLSFSSSLTFLILNIKTNITNKWL